MNKESFYSLVNSDWIKKIKVPSFESDFGVSEEVERCIFDKSAELLLKLKEKDSFFSTLADSCLHSRSQHTSVRFLKETLHTLDCMKTKEDIVRELAVLSKRKFPSILQVQYTIDKDGNIQLCIDGNVPSLPLYFYNDSEKMKSYKSLLHKLGTLLDVPELDKILIFEKNMAYQMENKWKQDAVRAKGTTFLQKFPSFPWATWFEEHGIQDWKSKTIYYRSPQWMRHIGKVLREVPLSYWKLYIARSYIVNCIRYLPPPFDEMDWTFFEKSAQGTSEKTPQFELFVQIVYSYLNDRFSKLFWEEYGSEKFVDEIEGFVKKLVRGAAERLGETEWMVPSTRKAAIHKVNSMMLALVRPKVWAPFTPFHLDSKNLLANIFALGEYNTEQMLDRIGKPYKYWEEGVYRVNAYYFSENNEIMIPYGTTLEPFYSSKASSAWNYGALGSIIGHEMCHGFDEDGRFYDEKGRKKKWWTRKDNLAYNYKTKALIKLFNTQKVCDKPVNGKKTLSENIADLGGLGIALYALQEDLREKGVQEKEKILEAYREFFISFASSWRTKYRKQKLCQVVELDRHSPAHLRVDCVVSQFDEWYEAFGITEENPFYTKPENRIRIF